MYVRTFAFVKSLKVIFIFEGLVQKPENFRYAQFNFFLFKLLEFNNIG